MRPLLLLWLLALAPTLPAAELRVAVAGNFAPVLERLAPGFEQGSGHTLRPSSGSTGRLYAQIVQGAPFDLFLAADAARPAQLESRGLVVPGTRTTYALGRLALWSPAADDVDALLARLQAQPPPRLAIANPRLAPYGAAARAWLVNEGHWAALGPGAVRGENIAQAFHFVASGNAELGLVALPQLRLFHEQTPGIAWTVPATLHPPIEQQAVLLRDSEAARALLGWLLTDTTQAQLRALGYDSP